MTTVLLAGGGTGGHLMPAFAVADATRWLHPKWRFVFAGAERGVEAQERADDRRRRHRGDRERERQDDGELDEVESSSAEEQLARINPVR